MTDRVHGSKMAAVVGTVGAVMLVGSVAGFLGAVLGIGGGVFLVPFLLIVVGLPFRQAAGISLATVIATSSAVTAASTGRNLINLRLGMVLEIATTLGGLAGGLTVAWLSQSTLVALFGLVTAAIGVVVLTRLDKRNIIRDPTVSPGRLGGRFFDAEAGTDVVYRVRRLPVALMMSFVAGNISGLLGIGGGTLKVPALNAWCGVPLRAAAATSALMIGVTAVSTAPIYYARGDLVPHLAAAAVLGVLAGSRAGMLFASRAPARRLKLVLAVVLFAVSLVMFARLW